MSKKVEVTAKNFNTILTSQVNAFSRFRDRLQDLLDFALVQASNGNYTYINSIVNAKLTGVDRRAVQIAIEDHADVQLIREDGNFRFKSKKTKGFQFKPMAVAWYKYAPTAEPVPVHADQGVISQIRRLSKALKGDGKAYIEKGEVNKTKSIIAHLAKTPGLDAEKVKAAMAA
jgi:hypothetical protein